MRIDTRKRTKPFTLAETLLTPETAIQELKVQLDKKGVRYEECGPNDLCVHFQNGKQRIGAFIDKNGVAQYQELFGEAGMDLQHTLDWIDSGQKML